MTVRALIALFCLICFYVQATAQEIQARYHVTDMINSSNNRIETWKMRMIKKKNETYLEVVKEAFAKEPLLETEIHKRWTRETRSPDDDTYLKEFLTVQPIDMEPGDHSYGYLELRECGSDKLLGNWPMFYEVEQVLGGLRATFHVLITQDLVLKNIRDYEENSMYFLPMRESRTTLFDGKVEEQVIFAREE